MAESKKKWAAFKGVLPAYKPNDDDSSFIEKVDKEKLSLAGISNIDIAKKYHILDAEKDKLEAQIKVLNIQIEACAAVLAERFDDGGIQSIKLDKIGTFYLKDEPYTKIVDKKQTKQWLINNDLEDFIAPQWQSLNALVKERLENNQEIPAGVEVSLKTTVVKRKA